MSVARQGDFDPYRECLRNELWDLPDGVGG